MDNPAFILLIAHLNQGFMMQKIAQKRSILNKLREKANIGGIAAEKFFNPEFERVMESLRTADNKIRAIASGTEIAGEDAGEDSVSLKDLLKNAKSNLNRREYMTSLAFLGRFHKKISSIAKFIEQLGFDVDKVHNDFLFKDLDEDQKKYLHDMKSRLASTQSILVAEAGIMDFLSNIGTERGRALAAWEKRYPKQVKKIKVDTASLLAKSEVMLSHILSALKEMATYRATRKIDDYMKAAQKISSQYSNYDNAFRNYYSANIKGFLEKQELQNPTQPTQSPTQIGNQEIKVEENSPNTMPVESGEIIESESVPFPLVQRKDITSEKDEAPDTTQTSTLNEDEEELPATLPSSKLEQTLPTLATHKKFYTSLQSLSNESPQVLSLYIAKYAKSIQKTDPITAIQLFKIVKTIKMG